MGRYININFFREVKGKDKTYVDRLFKEQEDSYKAYRKLLFKKIRPRSSRFKTKRKGESLSKWSFRWETRRHINNKEKSKFHLPPLRFLTNTETSPQVFEMTLTSPVRLVTLTSLTESVTSQIYAQMVLFENWIENM